MKLSNFLYGVAVCVSSCILLLSCKKEESFSEPGIERISDFKTSGVEEDNPALIAKVPVIVSSDFLQQIKDPSIMSSNARAKPPRGSSDIILPVISIDAPTNNSNVSGIVTVQVSASDNVGVSSVTLSVDGTTIASSSNSPYSFIWNSATVSNGSHTLAARAVDAAGNAKTVSIVVTGNNVTGGDITKPGVNITSPSNGSSISGAVNIAATASDNIGVSSVSFAVDGIVIGTDNSTPYTYSWNTSTVATGIHNLAATAKDAAGNSTSHSIQVTVNTTVLPPPTQLPSRIELLMPPVTSQGSEGSCVAFAVGYAARSCEQFYKTGSSSYSYTTNILSPEYLFNQIKTDASCSSSSLLTALDYLKYVGICTWQSMPYSSSNGCSLMPSSSQNAEASQFKITSYSSIYSSDVTAIKTMLASKHPLLITFAYDQNFANAGPGFTWSSYGSNIYQQHAVAICGYDDARHAIKVMNSWGTSWGEGGFTWIDYNFLPSLNASVYVMNL